MQDGTTFWALDTISGAHLLFVIFMILGKGMQLLCNCNMIVLWKAMSARNFLMGCCCCYDFGSLDCWWFLRVGGFVCFYAFVCLDSTLSMGPHDFSWSLAVPCCGILNHASLQVHIPEGCLLAFNSHNHFVASTMKWFLNCLQSLSELVLNFIKYWYFFPLSAW